MGEVGFYRGSAAGDNAAAAPPPQARQRWRRARRPAAWTWPRRPAT